MLEHSKKATIVLVIVTFAVIIGVPVLAHSMKFEADEPSVWFSREGIPHCPFCFKIVKMNEPYCRGCSNHFRWLDKQVVCWHCGGMKTCPICKGSRYFPKWHFRQDELCYDCLGTGVCQFCLPETAPTFEKEKGVVYIQPSKKAPGYNVYGGSCVRHPEQRY